MPSRTSFFSGALVRQTVFKRYWALWALYALVFTGVMALYVGSLGLGEAIQLLDAEKYRELSQSAYAFAPILAAVVGMIATICCFPFLNRAREAHFYHTLPMNRTLLFVSQYLSGLIMQMIPLLIAWSAMWGVLLAQGAAGALAGQMLEWLLIMVLAHVFFYSFAVLVAMVTGHTAMYIVIYAVLQAVSVFLYWMASTLASLYLYGMPSMGIYDPIWGLFSPAVYLVHQSNITSYLGWPSGIAIYAAYAGVGLVLAACALLVFRRRRVEAAGDPIAIRRLRPVFQYGFAVCFALLMMAMLSGAVRYELSGRDTLLTLTLLAFTLVGYYIARMAIGKTVRVLRGSLKGLLPLMAAMLLLTLGLQFDIAGYETRIPAQDEIEFAVVTPSNSLMGDVINAREIAMGDIRPWNQGLREAIEPHRLDPLTGDLAIAVRDYGPGVFVDPENIGLALSLHQRIIEGRIDLQARSQLELFYAMNEIYHPTSTHTVSVKYQLKNGTQISRSYDIRIYDEDLADPQSIALHMERLFNADEYRIKNYLYPETDPSGAMQAQIVADFAAYHYFSSGQSVNSITIDDPQDCVSLMEAVIRDLREGNLGKFYAAPGKAFREEIMNVGISISYDMTPGELLKDVWTSREWPRSFPMGLSVVLTKQAIHTLNWMEEHGIHSQAIEDSVAYSNPPDEEYIRLFSVYENMSTKEGVRMLYTQREDASEP